MTAKTPVYGLEYLVEGEPARNTRPALEANAKTIEAALLARAVTPPGAADLLALAGRVGTLEQAAVAPAALPLANGLAVAGLATPTFYRAANVVHLSSVIQLNTGTHQAAGTVLFTMAVGFRPAATVPFMLPVDYGGGTINMRQFRLAANGQFTVFSALGGAGAVYLFLDAAQWPRV